MRGASRLLLISLLCLPPGGVAEPSSSSDEARSVAVRSSTWPAPSPPGYLEPLPMRYSGQVDQAQQRVTIAERHVLWGVDRRPPRDRLPPRVGVGPSPDQLPEVTIDVVAADEGGDASSPTSVIPDHWRRLADCESGDWIHGGADFVAGSARWEWGAPGATVPPWGTRRHHGGLQFHPGTWTWVAGMLDLTERYPHAYDAPVEVQVRVAERVQELQGWRAWPTCGPLVGLTDR